ncbi:hypothetical protein BN1708_015832 [Verticillium longisporum]|uniref:Uncharacterized protein n=1 Tax=Verticillium longisporum TaxID=100787 RepID=A0A0G4M8S5_VERLO|nr:hypothetical protein BN1708_015832 [Verticillium longisporum]
MSDQPYISQQPSMLEPSERDNDTPEQLVLAAPRPDRTVAVKPNRQRMFYQPIVLEYALTMACQRRSPGYDTHSDNHLTLERELSSWRMLLKAMSSVRAKERNREEYTRICEIFIKAIRGYQNSAIGKEITLRVKDSSMNNSEPWRELQHCLGRLGSYGEAVRILVSASTRWPELFQDFIVTAVPSSVPHAKPLAKSNLTAAQVIGQMMRHEDAPPYLDQVAELQKFGLDNLIQQQVATSTFKPIVHAEVLVHNYLLKREINIASQYWHGWKTIGGSKPTCRLCNYYFISHPDRLDQVRDSHRNLYPNWRLPDVFESEGTRGNKARLDLLDDIIARVRDDTKRTLREKVPLGKKHDSNTFSTMPEYLDSRSQGSVPVGETSSVIAQFGMAMSRMQVSRDVTTEVKSEDDGSFAANDSAYHSDDEDGGATLVWQ